MTRVAVTGGGGLVGAELCLELARRGHAVLAFTRGRRLSRDAAAAGVRECAVGDLDEVSGEPARLDGCEVLVHLAARVHRKDEHPAGAERAYFEENTEATRRLAVAAIAAGTRRLVFMSSVKALSSESRAGALSPLATPHPEDAYGRSKAGAERALRELAQAARLEVAIVRTPLVYGPAAGANFRALVEWLRRGRPLPLASVANRRSIVSVWNLASALAHCCDLSRALAGTFHVADARPVSTAELVRLTAAGLGRPARLVPVSPRLLEAGLRLLGRGDLAQRLLGSLELETESSFAALGWRPGLTVEAGLARAARELAG